ncbi:MAG: isopeptide-forming domain-containing fimbrial protein [Clostridiales Family XIII bacterium]|nr:isopeptide-forming domain-containing fimbrial protein [Clostridiales Family XIII bacterium]
MGKGKRGYFQSVILAAILIAALLSTAVVSVLSMGGSLASTAPEGGASATLSEEGAPGDESTAGSGESETIPSDEATPAAPEDGSAANPPGDGAADDGSAAGGDGLIRGDNESDAGEAPSDGDAAGGMENGGNGSGPPAGDPANPDAGPSAGDPANPDADTSAGLSAEPAEHPADTGLAQLGVAAEPEAAGGDLSLFAVTYTLLFYSDGALYDAHPVQYVHENELAEEPPAPPLPAGKRAFIGWYTTQQTGEPAIEGRYDFSTPVTGDLTLYAGFSTSYLVQFKDAYGVIVQSDIVASGGTVPEPSFPVGVRPGYIFSNTWEIELPSGQAGNIFNFSNPINANYVLQPHFAPGYAVWFVSGGSNVVPQTKAAGDKADEPSDPTRQGYTFARWSKTPNGAAYDFDDLITGELILYAVWTPEPVSYTIVYWNEKANLGYNVSPGTDRANYDFAYSQKITTELKPAGSVLSAADIQTLAGDAGTYTDAAKAQVNAMNASTFYFSDADSNPLSGRGNTVINVYYKRIVYTFLFEAKNDGAGIGAPPSTPEMEAQSIAVPNATIVKNGQTYTSDTAANMYKFQAKYEESLTDQWPLSSEVKPGTGTYAAYVQTGWFVSNTINVYHNNIIDVNIAIWNFGANAGNGYTVRVAPSWFNPSGHSSTLYRLQYVEATAARQAEIEAVGNPIPNYDAALTPNGSNMLPIVQYPADSGKYFDLAADKTQVGTVPGTATTKTPSQRSLDFGGNGGSGLTMLNGVHVYGEGYDFWAANFAQGASEGGYWKILYTYSMCGRLSYTATFDADPYGIVAETSRNVKYGAPIGAIPTPTVTDPDMTFVGWYEEAEFRTPHSGSATMPAGDLYLYAKYASNANMVTILEKKGGDEVAGSPFGVADGDAAVNPGLFAAGTAYTGLGTFQGWYWNPYGDSRTQEYQWEMEIYDDITIFGAWQVDGFTVDYDADGGSGGSVPNVPVTETYDIQTKHRALAPTGDLTKGGDVFAGWTVSGDLSGKVYYPGMFVPIWGDTTLLARYIPASIPLAKVTYHETGTSGTPNVLTTYQRNEPVPLPGADDLGFEKVVQVNGRIYTYAFIGWSRTQNAAAPDRVGAAPTGVTYAEGHTVGFPDAALGDTLDGDSNTYKVDLYALWATDPVITGTADPAEGLYKTVNGVTDSAIGDGGIGKDLPYEIGFTLPGSLDLYSSLTVRDVLPAALAIKGGNLSSVYVLLEGAELAHTASGDIFTNTAGTLTYTAGSRTLQFVFSPTYIDDHRADLAGKTVKLKFVAALTGANNYAPVANVGQIILNGGTTQTPPAEVEVIEPIGSLTKKVSLDGGATWADNAVITNTAIALTYRISAGFPADMTGYDSAELQDILPAALQLDGALASAVTVAVNGAAVGAGDGALTQAGNVISYIFDDGYDLTALAGKTVTMTVKAKIAASVTDATSITNSARLIINGGDPDDPGVPDVPDVTPPAVIFQTPGSLTKTASASKLTLSDLDKTLGYTLAFALPDTLVGYQTVVFEDALPSSLTITGTLADKVKLTVGASNTPVTAALTFSANKLTATVNAADLAGHTGETLSLHIDTVFTAAAQVPGALTPGSAIGNTAALSINGKQVSAASKNIPIEAMDGPTSLTKKVSLDGGATWADNAVVTNTAIALTYRISAGFPADMTGYDSAELQDILPAALVLDGALASAVTVAVNGAAVGAGDGALTQTGNVISYLFDDGYDLTALAGKTVTMTVKAKIAASVTDATSITNSARLIVNGGDPDDPGVPDVPDVTPPAVILPPSDFTKTAADGDRVYTGDLNAPVVYDIRFTLPGDLTGYESFAIVDRLPSGMAITDAVSDKVKVTLAGAPLTGETLIYDKDSNAVYFAVYGLDGSNKAAAFAGKLLVMTVNASFTSAAQAEYAAAAAAGTAKPVQNIAALYINPKGGGGLPVGDDDSPAASDGETVTVADPEDVSNFKKQVMDADGQYTDTLTVSDLTKDLNYRISMKMPADVFGYKSVEIRDIMAAQMSLKGGSAQYADVRINNVPASAADGALSYDGGAHTVRFVFNPNRIGSLAGAAITMDVTAVVDKAAFDSTGSSRITNRAELILNGASDSSDEQGVTVRYPDAPSAPGTPPGAPSTTPSAPVVPVVPIAPVVPAAPAAPVVSTAPAAPAIPVPTNESRVIPDTSNGGETSFEDAVKAEGIIGIGGVPLSAPRGFGAWALLNLGIMLAGLFVAAITIFKAAAHRRKQKKADSRWVALSGALAAVSLILFLLTQDMSQSVVWADQWTLLFTVILALESAGTFLARGKTAREDV